MNARRHRVVHPLVRLAPVVGAVWPLDVPDVDVDALGVGAGCGKLLQLPLCDGGQVGRDPQHRRCLHRTR